MPSFRRRIFVVTACVAVLAPAAAHAQGAGDEQYSDPFAGSGTTTAKPKPKPKPANPAPAAAAPSTSTSSPAAPSATAGASAAPAPSAAQLPRSGADTGLVAAGGAALLLTGLALRRRSAADR